MPCPRCKDDGLYTVMRDGHNPFLMSIFEMARHMEARLCDCPVGQALALYRDFHDNQRASMPAQK